ncbi:hypothetical protein MUY35_11695 [Aliiroseovarius sp. S1339]|uniref:hypothetical protein n=1 Tax=Aliiroseovarius sp. S1339 TaxID=2936990 RepID=UPI0020C17367|nr:hypothetical protein [Aliiroseovarius sp. S1339]MCK8464515.1 hypothetical protein [Aliiroseovarius sp. S1339]
MENAELRSLLQKLVETFNEVPKPEPLSSFENSHDDEEVAIFNSTNWETATYWEFCHGLEGWIICSPETRVYLTPRLLRMLLLRQDGKHEGAADNLSFELLPHLQEPTVFGLLNSGQMSAVIDAVAYVDRTRWYPSGSDAAGDLARCWGLQDS